MCCCFSMTMSVRRYLAWISLLSKSASSEHCYKCYSRSLWAFNFDSFRRWWFFTILFFIIFLLYRSIWCCNGSSGYVFSLVIIWSLVFEVIGFIECFDKRNFHSCVCKIADSRGGDYECDDSCCLIRCSTCRTPVVKLWSIMLIDFMSLSSKAFNSAFCWIVFSLFMISFLIIILKSCFLHTDTPLGLEVDNSLKDMSVIVSSGSFTYNCNCKFIYSLRYYVVVM